MEWLPHTPTAPRSVLSGVQGDELARRGARQTHNPTRSLKEKCGLSGNSFNRKRAFVPCALECSWDVTGCPSSGLDFPKMKNCDLEFKPMNSSLQ